MGLLLLNCITFLAISSLSHAAIHPYNKEYFYAGKIYSNIPSRGQRLSYNCSNKFMHPLARDRLKVTVAFTRGLAPPRSFAISNQALGSPSMIIVYRVALHFIHEFEP